MVFLHAPFVLFRYGFFYVMLISDIRKQNLVCIFLHPHRSAEFRPLEETVCGKQSAYCSAILHPHSMINLCFFLSFFCRFVLFLFAFFTLLCRFSPSFQIGKLSQKVREWHKFFFFFQGREAFDKKLMLKLHCCQQSPESASSEINEHWTCSERADGNMRAHKLINIVYWIEWQTNKKKKWFRWFVLHWFKWKRNKMNLNEAFMLTYT